MAHSPIPFNTDLEKIVRKSKKKSETSTIPLIRSLYLTKEGAIGIDDVSFDIKFELSLFKSKSKSDLSQIVFDEARFQEIVRNSSLKNIQLTKEDKEFF